MNTNRHRRVRLMACGLLLAVGVSSPAQWIAYNDHAAGPGTHPNATRYHILGSGESATGLLRNVFNGNEVPVALTITRSGLVLGETSGDNPADGTPLHVTFGGYVDFAGSPTPNVAVGQGGQVVYTLTGLAANKRYQVYGGAVRGGPDGYANRWALCELTGADSFRADHSAGVLTAPQVPALAANQAALNTGLNHTSSSGDMIGWADIDPGADGTIQIVCTKYGGEVPGGSSAGTVGYALTGLTVGEYVFEAPPGILQQPTNQIVDAGRSATFSVLTAGPVAGYQWRRNGEPIPGATTDTYTLAETVLSDSGSRFSVLASNQFGGTLSEEALLVVHDPDRVWTPVAFDHPWRYESSGDDLGTAWREIGFNDATWQEGPGALGFESESLPEPIRTPLELNGKITYYFRASFLVTNAPLEHDLNLSYQIDDGAVIYLNGEEWHRVRMPEGPINANVPAVTTVGNAAVEEISFSNPPLHLGTNWLAVEVHQSFAGSSDLVFGLSILATQLPPTPLTITNQPVDLEVHQFQSASFSVGVQGSGVFYQWHKDGEPIPGASRPVYAIPRAEPSDAGTYVVSASNVWSFLQSDPVVLTVGEPVPLQILNQPADETIRIGEPVSFTVDVGGDTPHFFQWFKDGQPLAGATTRTLTLARPLQPDTGDYSLVASNHFSSAQTEPIRLEVRRHPRGEPGSLHRDFVMDVVPEGAMSRFILRQRDGRILVSAGFQTVNGVEQPRLARLSQDGVVDETFRPDFGGVAYAMAEQADGKLVFGGTINSVDGRPRNNLARLHPDGRLDLDFDPRPSAPTNVWDVAVQPDGRILAVGGGSNAMDDGAIYRYHPDGTLDFADLNTDGGDEQNAFYYAVDVQPDGKILVGGRFQKYHGLDHAFLIRLHPDGSLDETFLRGTNAPNGYVLSVQVLRGKIYASGLFTSIAGHSRTGLARLEMDGSIDPTFQPPVLSPQSGALANVLHFVVQPKSVIIAGSFSAADGIPMGSVARLRSDGSLDENFSVGMGPNERIYRAAIDLNGDIYLAGLFTEFNGEIRGGVAKIYGAGFPSVDYRRTAGGALRVLWPGDREDLLLESAESPGGSTWSRVTESTNKLHDLNVTIVEPTAPARVFRLRVP